MAMTDHQELPSRTKKSFEFKRFFGGLTSVVAIMTAFLFKAIILVIKTPFFILFYLKNCFVIGLFSTVIYTICYIGFSNINMTTTGIDKVFEIFYYNNPKYVILLVVVAILAFFATVGEFTD
ncbi:hypothetical protein PJ261_02265 [Streptococcus dysgalactiae]|uniref:hypothetical protein n=1 Tax=Streptococcus dysgalactiae TaxID=1334 RepID=UPI0035D06F03